MDDKEKQFVNELLAASLRRYASAEARPGLEGRVLAGVRSRLQAERRRTAWAWVVGIAAVATMLTLVVIHWPHRQPAPLPLTGNAPAVLSGPAVAKIEPRAEAPSPRRPRGHATPSRVDTRPQQFPTPRPLSEQEKLLLVYTQSIQNSSGAFPTDADQSSERDLEIPPIRIATIKIDPLPSFESGDEK